MAGAVGALRLRYNPSISGPHSRSWSADRGARRAALDTRPKGCEPASGSCRCVVKRDVPGRRLSSQGWIVAPPTARIPGGHPSTIAPIADPVRFAPRREAEHAAEAVVAHCPSPPGEGGARPAQPGGRGKGAPSVTTLAASMASRSRSTSLFQIRSTRSPLLSEVFGAPRVVGDPDRHAGCRQARRPDPPPGRRSPRCKRRSRSAA